MDPSAARAFAEHFDRLAARYSELRASSARVDPLTREVAEFGKLRGCRVLDVGCGPGASAFRETRRVLRPSGRLVITTTDPDGFESFWMRPYFPSYVAIERSRFPDGKTVRRELEESEFSDVSVRPYVMRRRFTKAVALEKLRGRAYSTFALMRDDEYAAGVAAAEAALPDEVDYDLLLLNVVATRS